VTFKITQYPKSTIRGRKLNKTRIMIKGYGDVDLAKQAELTDGVNSLKLKLKQSRFFAIKLHAIQELNVSCEDTSFEQPTFSIVNQAKKILSLGISSRRLFEGLNNGFVLYADVENEFFEEPPTIKIPYDSPYLSRSVGRSGLKLNEYKPILEYSLRRRQVVSRVVIVEADLFPVGMTRAKLNELVKRIESAKDQTAASNLLELLPVWHGLRTFFSLYFDSRIAFQAENVFKPLYPEIRHDGDFAKLTLRENVIEFDSKPRLISETPIFFLFNLSDVTVYHGSNLVTNEYLVLDDSSESNKNFQTAMWPSLKWGNPNSQLLAIPPLGEAKTLVANGQFLPSNTNWAHFLEDIAPRAALMIEKVGEQKPLYSLTGDKVQIELLEAIGIGRLESLEFFSPISFKELTCVFHLNQRNLIVDGDETVEVSCADVLLMNYLRKTLFKRYKPHVVKKRKIFVYRDKKLFRRLVNQKRVAKIMESHGFEVIDIEGWGLEDRIKLYFESSDVVYEYGAGGANNYFAQDKINVIELRHPGNVNSREQYGYIKTTNANWKCINGKKANPLLRIFLGTDSWSLPLQEFKDYLKLPV